MCVSNHAWMWLGVFDRPQDYQIKPLIIDVLPIMITRSFPYCLSSPYSRRFMLITQVTTPIPEKLWYRDNCDQIYHIYWFYSDVVKICWKTWYRLLWEFHGGHRRTTFTAQVRKWAQPVLIDTQLTYVVGFSSVKLELPRSITHKWNIVKTQTTTRP